MTLALKRFGMGLVSLLFGAMILMPISVGAQFDPLDRPCDEQPDSTICQELQANKDADGRTEDPITGEDGLLMSIINILSIVVSVISVIIIVVSGITMTLSGGDSTKVQNSRNAIIYAMVGLVVVALSRTIIIFVVNAV